MYKKTFLAILSLIMVCSMAVNLTGCATKVQAADLMEGVNANTVTGKAADDAFTQAQMRLAVDLFQSSVLESKDENVLISPLSIQLALAMTANGADGDTKAEMEALLGGEISLEDLNEYLYSYVSNLPSAEKHKLQIDPAPDTLIRVFMAWKAADSFVELPEQELTAPERTGFTVIEWGGTEVQ